MINRTGLLFVFLALPSCSKTADHVFGAEGNEIDCAGRKWDECIAAHCLHGYETIAWRDLGGGSTFRCKP